MGAGVQGQAEPRRCGLARQPVKSLLAVALRIPDTPFATAQASGLWEPASQVSRAPSNVTAAAQSA